MANLLYALGWALWTYLRPAVNFRPTLTQLALRVENVLPSLAGRLASSVEFATAGVDQSNPLAERAVRETQRRLSGESVSAVVSPSRTRRDVGQGAGAIELDDDRRGEGGGVPCSNPDRCRHRYYRRRQKPPSHRVHPRAL